MLVPPNPRGRRFAILQPAALVCASYIAFNPAHTLPLPPAHMGLEESLLEPRLEPSP